MPGSQHGEDGGAEALDGRLTGAAAAALSPDADWLARLRVELLAHDRLSEDAEPDLLVALDVGEGTEGSDT